MVTAIYVGIFAWAALYVLASYVLMRMAQMMEVKLYWMALIPVLQMYVVGKMIQTIDLAGFQLKWPEFILPSIWIIIGILVVAPYVGLTALNNVYLMVIVPLICAYIWIYAVQTFFLTFGCSEKKALVFTILGGVLILPLPILVLMVRNNEPEYEYIDDTPKRKKNSNKKRRSGKNKLH